MNGHAHRSDLSPAEQEHVRAILRVLRAKLGGWHGVEKALPISHATMCNVIAGRSEVSASLAFRVARAFDAHVDHARQARPAGAGIRLERNHAVYAPFADMRPPKAACPSIWLHVHSGKPRYLAPSRCGTSSPTR